MTIGGRIIITQGDAPDTPSSGKSVIYAKTDQNLYLKDDAGNETLLATTSGTSGVTDHGELSGLSDDDHPSYLNTARGDVRYYTQAQVDTISGSIQTSINTVVSQIPTDYYTTNEVDVISGTLQSQIDNITVSSGVTDHGVLTGLLDDDHTQYHTDTRGDVRYYTKATSDYMHVEKYTGIIDEPTYTYLGSGSILIPPTSAVFNTDPMGGGSIHYLTVSGSTVFIPENQFNTVVAKYNSGNPIYDVLDITQIPLVDQASILTHTVLYRLGDTLFSLPVRDMSHGLGPRLHLALSQGVGGVRSGKSGFDVTISGTNYLNISSAVMLDGATVNTHTDYNSEYNSLHFFHHSDYGVWTSTSGSMLNNTHYDDGSGLIELSDNAYSNLWIYKSNATENRAFYVTSPEEYSTLDTARAADIPTDLPQICIIGSYLLARVIIQKGGYGGYISSAFVNKFPGIDNSYHNGLSSIQGGSATEYYHLTQSQHSNIEGNTPTFTSVTATHYGNGSNLTNISHSSLTNLATDNHTQYHTDARGDVRYYKKLEVDTISGSLDNKVLYVDGSKSLTGDWDAGNYRVTASGFSVDNAQLELLASVSFTGILSGGSLSINSLDSSYIDIGAGSSIYFDASDPENLVVERLSWPDTSMPAGISGSTVRWLGVYRSAPGAGSFVSQTEFTPAEKRTVGILGRFWTTSGTGLAVATNFIDTSYGIADSFKDYIYATGALNISGNVFSPSESYPMKLDKSEGEAFRFGANFPNNPASPNLYTGPLISPQALYRYTCQGWAYQIPRTDIDPDNYDLNGAITSVPTDKWSVQRVFWYPVSNTTTVHYGQAYYDTKSLAIDAVSTENPSITSDLLVGSILRAYLIIKEGTDDLSDTSQAEVIEALGISGLIHSITNHGNLGGLEDDDHPQYLNATRGDARYYTQTQVDVWRDEHPFVASGISYTNTSWDLNNTAEALDALTSYSDSVIGTGRLSPEESLVHTSGHLITVPSGYGYISYQGHNSYVTWSATTVSDTLEDVEGLYHIYVNDSGEVLRSTIDPGSKYVVDLGDYYYDGRSITLTSPSTSIINSALNRTSTFFENMGSFIYDFGGIVGSQLEKPLAITSTACKVQYGFRTLDLVEISSTDYLSLYLGLYKTADTGWENDYYGFDNFDGNIPIATWNDTTQSGLLLSGTAYFTQYSNTITCDADLTGYLTQGDYINGPIRAPGTMCVVSGITWTGSQTEIVSYHPYTAITTSGTATKIAAMLAIPLGKYTKHLIIRSLTNKMFMIYGQDIYDDLDSAIGAGSPAILPSLEKHSLNMAYIIVSPDSTSLDIRDIRPIPFSTGGGGTQTIGSSADHGELTGLLDDDHLQYLLANGSRNIISKIKYTTHPAFSADTELTDKKYVDDTVNNKQHDHGGLAGLTDDDHTQYSKVDGTRDYSAIVSYSSHPAFVADTNIIDKKYVDDLAASFNLDHGGLIGLSDDDHAIYTKADGTRAFTGKVSYNTHPIFTTNTELVDKQYVDDSIPTVITDHGALGGLSDDDHTQYLNITRGDARYYTETEVNSLFTAHNIADAHNDVYYTEAEVEALIAVVSGTLQTQIDLSESTVYFAESETLSSTTSTTYQNKISLTFGSGLTGNYRLGWAMSFNAASANKDVNVRFYNTTDAVEVDSNSQKTNSDTNWFSFSGFKRITFTGTNKTFSLQYAAGTSACNVRYARIEAWRVS